VDLKETLRRLEAARDDPNALALATVDIVLGSHGAMAAQTFEAAAVPHWFDERLLRALLGDDVPPDDGWFDRLVGLSVIERFRAHEGWNVHEVTRLAVRKRLDAEQRTRFRALSDRAAALFTGDGAVDKVERIYHRLCANPDAGVNELRRLWKDWAGISSLQPLQMLGKALDELCAQQLLTSRTRGYALVVLGSVREDRIGLAEWKTMAEEAVELLTRAGDEVGLVDAHTFLGKAHREYGHISEALASFEKAREYLARWSSTVADPREAADERADLHEAVGRTLALRGQSHETLREFEAALRVREELYQKAPDDELTRHQLAVAYTDVGDALSPTDRGAEAETHYNRALKLIETTPAQRIGRETIDQNIARLQSRLGDFFLHRSDFDGALERYEAADRIFLRLAAHDPDHFAWKYDVAQTAMSQATVHFSRAEYDKAEERYGVARTILKDLAERDPTNPLWKENLGLLCASFASLRDKEQRWSEAVAEYSEAERLLRESSEANPDRAEWKASLAGVQRDLAVFALYRLFDAADDEQKTEFVRLSVSMLLASRAMFTELSARDERNLAWRDQSAAAERHLARGLDKAARVQREGLNLPGLPAPEELSELALQSFDRSARLTAQLLSESARPDFKRGYVLARSGGARVAERLGRRPEALAMYREALEIASDLHRSNMTNQFWADDVTSLQEAVRRLEGEDSPEPPRS
jgi:tetratricopeptide (TPR) repeat protein